SPSSRPIVGRAIRIPRPAFSKGVFRKNPFNSMLWPVPELPVHEVRESQALRALAHPLRIRLLEELAIGGELTATQAAERVDESPANCSWHLRQLARYGFVEE